jgi:hypothetical protein
MDVKSVKDLRAVLKLCREFGVDKLKIDNIEIELGQEPVKPQANPPPPVQYTPGGITPDTKIETIGGLTEDQLLYYSVNSDQ